MAPQEEYKRILADLKEKARTPEDIWMANQLASAAGEKITLAYLALLTGFRGANLPNFMDYFYDEKLVVGPIQDLPMTNKTPDDMAGPLVEDDINNCFKLKRGPLVEDDINHCFKLKCIHSIRAMALASLTRDQKLTEETESLDAAITFYIKKMYPHLYACQAANNEFAKNQIRELEKLVKKMVLSHPREDGDKDSVKVILECLQRVFPNRTYYHLMIHWARRAPVDYVKVRTYTCLLPCSHACCICLRLLPIVSLVTSLVSYNGRK